MSRDASSVSLSEFVLTPIPDKKCPWTGLVSIRGRLLTGKVVSTKMTRTVVIRREYLHYVPKYNRYERRHKNLPIHVSPAFRVEIGDIIVAGTYHFPLTGRPVPPSLEDCAFQRP